MYQLPRWSNQAKVIENSDSTQQYRLPPQLCGLPTSLKVQKHNHSLAEWRMLDSGKVTFWFRTWFPCSPLQMAQAWSSRPQRWAESEEVKSDHCCNILKLFCCQAVLLFVSSFVPRFLLESTLNQTCFPLCDSGIMSLVCCFRRVCRMEALPQGIKNLSNTLHILIYKKKMLYFTYLLISASTIIPHLTMRHTAHK